jgi:DNA polymerase III alpha subunit
MKPVVTDIDIDVPDREQVLKLFPHVVANNGKSKHNTGIYFHRVPVNPMTNRCSIDYKQAEEMGYFKIDVLNVAIYKEVRDEAHMEALLATEPLWELLEEEEFCSMLFHMRGHHDICRQMKPQTIPQLAAVLAMIRPAKRHLVGKSWSFVDQHVWVKPMDNSYYFKKSHAVGYSLAVKMHMNILVEQFGS